VALNFAFRPLFGVAGLALSTSLTYSLLVAVFARVARRRWGPLIGPADLRRGRAGGLAAVTGVAVAWAVASTLPGDTRGHAILAIVAATCAASVPRALHRLTRRPCPARRET